MYSHNDEYLFAVKDWFKDQVFETRENFITTVKIANQNAAALVDTGASANIFNMRTFKEINNRLQKPLKLKRTKTKVSTYGKDDLPLKILGEVDTVIETKTKFLESKFFVAETKNINLLSGVTSLALGLIKIDKIEHMCSTIDDKKNGNAQKEEMKANETRTYPERLRNIIEKHKKIVFQNNIEKIKNYSVKLHIDLSVPPVAQTERRIPFVFGDKVNEELKRLENEGIIEDVAGEPTPWLNPFVIVLKGEHNTRICIDMRAANKLISRTRYLLLRSTICL